jgi:hypothetical protein
VVLTYLQPLGRNNRSRRAYPGPPHDLDLQPEREEADRVILGRPQRAAEAKAKAGPRRTACLLCAASHPHAARLRCGAESLNWLTERCAPDA